PRWCRASGHGPPDSNPTTVRPTRVTRAGGRPCRGVTAPPAGRTAGRRRGGGIAIDPAGARATARAPAPAVASSGRENGDLLRECEGRLGLALAARLQPVPAHLPHPDVAPGPAGGGPLRRMPGTGVPAIAHVGPALGRGAESLTRL